MDWGLLVTVLEIRTLQGATEFFNGRCIQSRINQPLYFGGIMDGVDGFHQSLWNLPKSTLQNLDQGLLPTFLS